MGKRVSLFACALFVVFCLFLGTESSPSVRRDSPSTSPADRAIEENSDKMIAEGRHTFRYDTFGDEAFWGARNNPDLITPKLGALHFYQLAIPAPKPLQGSFDEEAAERGRQVFNGQAKCANCHVPPLFTEPGWNMHTPAEIGIDDFQANRAPDKAYRTSPLKGLWTHTKGGFYHDGRFATLLDVVNHYDQFFALGLTDQQKTDLLQYLKSL